MVKYCGLNLKILLYKIIYINLNLQLLIFYIIIHTKETEYFHYFK